MKGKNKYDLIIMDNVLEHIEEPKKALDKIKSLMNTSSKLYIAIPNIFKYKNNFRDPFGHTINYYENNIKYLFENNGFKILKLKKHYNYLNFIAKIEATNKKIKYQFKKDSKNKFDRVRNFIKKAVKYKVSIKKKFLLLEKNIKKNNQKIILFGSSNFALEFLNSTNLKKNIKFIVDSNPIYHNKKKFNLNVMSPQKIKNEKFDKILITSRAFSKDIYKTLIKLGVAKNKIIKL